MAESTPAGVLRKPLQPWRAEQYGSEDPSLGFLQQPHTLAMLVFLIGGIAYVALYLTDDVDRSENIKWGLFAAVVVFLLYGMVQFRDGPFVRPHPVVWRAVLALSIAYELFLVWLMFQKLDDARQLFKFINPALGVPLAEKQYAQNCDITFDTMRNQMDEFVLAHILGWFGKSLILRDFWLSWMLSIMFEVMEYSLQHQLPNFAECWWDHWILDVLLCNGIGIWLGMKTLDYLEKKPYDWRGWSEYRTRGGKLVRAMAQFTPYSWEVFEWGVTKTFRRWISALLVLTMFLQVELNAFYLKAVLWLPPPEMINTYRLLLHWLMGLVGVHEVYRFVTDPRCKRLGSQSWISIAIIQTESLLCVKWGRGLFPNPAPPEVVISWTIAVVALVLFTVLRFSRLGALVGIGGDKKKPSASVGGTTTATAAATAATLRRSMSSEADGGATSIAELSDDEVDHKTD